MRTWPDDYLNHWADVYVARGVRRYRITLEQFLARPEQMLVRVERFETANRLAAEPRQHRAERREDMLGQQRGDLLVQKLWHGASSRGRRDMPVWCRR